MTNKIVKYLWLFGLNETDSSGSCFLCKPVLNPILLELLYRHVLYVCMFVNTITYLYYLQDKKICICIRNIHTDFIIIIPFDHLQTNKHII